MAKRNGGVLQRRQQALIRDNRDLSTADLSNRLSHANKSIMTVETDMERFRALLTEAQSRLRALREEAEVLQALIEQRR